MCIYLREGDQLVRTGKEEINMSPVFMNGHRKQFRQNIGHLLMRSTVETLMGVGKPLPISFS